jgi:enoyl-CoA hydratase
MAGDAVALTEPGPGVRLATLNRPGLRNAMTEEMTHAWNRVLDKVAADPETRVLVVTGAESSFCSGADLSWFDEASAEDVTVDRLRDRLLPFYRSWLRPRSLPFPVIAAVNGPAVGAGVCLALACDLRFAGRDAHFSTPFAHRAAYGGMGVTWLLPEAIGVVHAREMMYLGMEVAPEQALGWGLVSGVADDVLEHVLGKAARMAEAGPIALRLTKTGLEQSATGLEASLQWEALAQPTTMATADLQESIAAFRERREPRFLGR